MRVLRPQLQGVERQMTLLRLLPSLPVKSLAGLRAAQSRPMAENGQSNLDIVGLTLFHSTRNACITKPVVDECCNILHEKVAKGIVS
jgi:hypothetical protein